MNRRDRDTANQRAWPHASQPSDTPTQQTPRVHYVPAYPQQRPPQQRPPQAPYPPSHPQQRPNGGDRSTQATVIMPRVQPTGAQPTAAMPRVQHTAAQPAQKRATPRMPKQQAMQVVSKLKKFIFAGSVMAFGVVTALAASHTTGVTASAASSTSATGASSATATPTATSTSDDNGSFFNQPSNSSSSSSGVSSSSPSQQPVSGSSVS